VAGFWTTLAEMLVSPIDRLTLSDVRGYPVHFVARPRESGRRYPPQPAPFSLLCRNARSRPLLYVCFIVPASEVSATSSTRQDQISFVDLRIRRSGDELDLSRREPLNRAGNPQEMPGLSYSVRHKKE
jgi:hypothetical protein